MNVGVSNVNGMEDSEGEVRPTTTTNPHLIKLNISGVVFTFHRDPILRRLEPPGSFLTRFVKSPHSERLTMCDVYIEERDEYFFGRLPRYFESILDFELTGQLHKPQDLCFNRFLSELQWWGIPSSCLSSCCAFSEDELVPPSTTNSSPTRTSSLAPTSAAYSAGHRRESIETENRGRRTGVMVIGNHSGEETDTHTFLHNNNNNINNINNSTANFPDDSTTSLPEKHWHKIRRWMWTFFEDPGSSTGAKLFAIISICFIGISVLGLILGSIPELQDENKEPHVVLIYTEYTCIAWFTIELVLRFTVCPSKCLFIKSFMNIVDLSTVLPFYVELVLSLTNVGGERVSDFKGPMLVMRILRVLRVARVFKIARYSTGLKSFGLTLQKSVAEMGMLGLFLLTAVIFFSTVMYFLEKDVENTKFPSIPAACWWCVVTMTTVGYGDLVPHTIGGKIVASLASISGVLVLAFPITMIVEKFAQEYNHKDQNKTSTKRKRGRRIGKFV